ncbi:carnosine synthase 1-like [Lepisosteus oculatus]|uniref:carnosine synthase 1-like n=1 Tax=Lepisosteus oculatus TaxID=7918 RepID=UPI003721E2A1
MQRNKDMLKAPVAVCENEVGCQSYNEGDGPHVHWEESDPALQEEGLSEYYSSIQQILLELGLPETRDRTATPRADLTDPNMTICVLASPDKYLPILLEGGRRCPGHVMLCLSSSWLSKAPSQKHPGLFSLLIHKAVTFGSGGCTNLDTFQPPRRASYFLSSLGDHSMPHKAENGQVLGTITEEDLDCPTCGSPELTRVVEDVLLTRQLVAQRGIKVPPTLAFAFRPNLKSLPPNTQVTVVSAQEKEELQKAMLGAVEEFLHHPDLGSCHKVMVQHSGAKWCFRDNVTVHQKSAGEEILQAALGLLPKIQQGESILITASYDSVQPLKPWKLQQSVIFKEPEVSRRKLDLHIRATVCRSADDQPQLMQVVCWVNRTEAPIRSSPTVLQSLEVTLQDWGFTKQDYLTELQQLLKQWAEAAMQGIMDYQSQLSSEERGGATAQIDFIGVEFALTQHKDRLHPFLLSLTSHHRGIQSTATQLLQPHQRGSTVGPLVQAMCHRAHCSFIADKTILYIGAGNVNKLRVFQSAKKYHIKIILVDCNSSHPAFALVWKTLHHDFSDHTQDESHAHIISKMVQDLNVIVDGCTTFNCDTVILTSLVCKELGLPSDGFEALVNAKKKSHSHRHLGGIRHGLQHLPNPSLYAVPCLPVDSEQELEEAMAQVGFPAAVKLEKGSGGMGVKIVENSLQCQQHFKSLKWDLKGTTYHMINKGFKNEPLLMEFISGPRYVVDLIIFQGKLLAAFVSDCGPPGLSYVFNTSHIMPTCLCPEKETQLAIAAYQCCLHCGLKNGVYNLDMKLTETGPKLIEINPRPGGSYLPSWIKTVYGTDIILCTFLIACEVHPHIWTPEPRGYVVGISSPVFQHVQALENPSFPVILKALEENGIINSNKVGDMKNKIDFDFSSFNITSFSPNKDEAFHRLIAASKILDLDSEKHPVKYFLDFIK